MAQDTTPAIVVYQGTGSDAPFSIPFDKGYYGEIKVLFVRRGLADYTYYPDTYVVSGRLYAWQNGNTSVFTHTPRPAVGAVIYTDEDVAPVTSITLKDLSDNENIYLRSAEDDVLVRRLYAWKYENIIVYTDTPTPTLSSVVTDYQWHELPLRIVSLTNIVVSAISGQTITVDEVIYTRAVQHDISNNLLLTWTGDTLEVGDFICIIRDTERGQPYEMPINQKHVEFALDNLERQIQELKDATDSALKVDPSYDIEDSHKMNPIQWLETILRSMDKSVRAFRYADGWLDYSLDDPNIAEISKTWRHLLSTENIKNIREASRVLDDEIIYWTEYQDREGNWKTLCKSDEWDSKIDEALEISQEAKDTADEAKEIAVNAQTVAGQAKDIAEDAKETAEGIEGIAQEALDKVTQEITDREDADDALQNQITDNKDAIEDHIANTNNPHSVTKAQVGLSNVDNTSDLDKPISTATQSALDLKMPISTKYGASISLTIDSSTYVVTAQLKDQDNNNLGTAQTIDLPLESVVVSGSYDSDTKEVVLTLQGGSTIRFSVADLVSGLQTEITALNMLSADLVDDTNTTHKFVTTTEKSTWNGKQDSISDLATIRSGAAAGATAVQPADLATVATTGDYDDLLNKPTIPAAQVNSDWNANSGVAQILNKPTLATVATSGSYTDLSNKPTIPTVNNPTITITQGGVTKGSFTLNQATGDTIALDAGGGGGSADIDNLTITENADQEIQAVAVIDQNTGIAKTWTGTMAEYDAIVTKDPETEYIITDDIGGSATEIGQITEALNNKVDKGHQVVEFQAPTAANNYTWYRKYADGWVEMGGFKVIDSSAQAGAAYTTATVSFPLALSVVCGWNCQAKHDRFNAGFATDLRGAAASSGSLYQVNDSSNSFSNPYVYWEVRGMAA